MGREPWPSGTVHLCGYLAARSLFCSLQGHGAQSSVAMRPLSGYMTLHKPIERHANQQPPWFFIIGEAIFKRVETPMEVSPVSPQGVSLSRGTAAPAQMVGPQSGNPADSLPIAGFCDKNTPRISCIFPMRQTAGLGAQGGRFRKHID
ncbi:predicted protein [Chaetomium globosum CBS 148.51]|uniref:Uncharacterized protein n=1 Tax=Chaetomium globosum (strain ATCC 6205 / CBS 148.51 / DSM 1962 / NBRC 6347 / NRRL 1970) TaxID=306901 RepID=Q2H6K7_CHAGB|nr:uncharacterized protein CHGG_05708 [Chaetomium globosum CBS 148.51]EAQ89089.1 predicted protein [Chaetomium globosum CBS 148.51]